MKGITNFFSKCLKSPAKGMLVLALAFFALLFAGANEAYSADVPVYISFHWHMHQPVYWPYETINETEASGSEKYSFSVAEVHNSRSGPYTSWPRDAVSYGKDSTQHGGAQVSFSGSLIENLNNLWGGSWMGSYAEAKGWQTSLGNPRLDMVGFGYHHPLMGLIDRASIRRQIQMHKRITTQTFGGSYSKGMFPPENAFSKRMIPALAGEGIEWVMVDNIHFDRASKGYPWVNGSNLFPPNKADQLNPDPNDWAQRSGMWAPSKTSAGFGYRPHYTEYVNPETGEKTRIIVVPTARYEGNEDGRGGFGALNYEEVLSQLLPHNTDPNHPILVVLHHDGDNYGGGTDSYYHSNFQSFVNWVSSNPDFEWTTIQDYLDRFPPGQDDVIHVEDGSWAGADNGDPEFAKWNGDENEDGYSYDRNSWASITAAENRVKTAEAIQPSTGVDAVISGSGNDTDKAWHYFLVGQTSCYWYWDGTEKWDSHPTRAANLAVAEADKVINANPGQDSVPPSVYTLQRDPYNPGAFEWQETPESRDFSVWTFIYDVSGLASVQLKYRAHSEEVNDSHRVYQGGTWTSVSMSGSEYGSSLTAPQPTYRAKKYVGEVAGLSNVYVDYYVEAVDAKGNVSKSDIRHVFVGSGDASGDSGSTDTVAFSPEEPSAGYPVTVTYTGGLASGESVIMHWGYDNFGTGAEDTAMNKQSDGSWTVSVTIPEEAINTFDCVFHDGNNNWDNNGGQDYNATLVPWQGSDSVDPVIGLDSPTDGASYADTLVSVVATATDNIAVSKVVFTLNGQTLAEDTTAPYSVDFPALDYTNGSYTITATAHDTAGNTASDDVSISIDNSYGSGEISISLDQDAGSLEGDVAFSADASIILPTGTTSGDQIATVSSVAFSVDGNSLATDTSSPYAVTLDTTAHANGSHTLKAVMTDSYGRTTEATRQVTIDNSALETRTVYYYQEDDANVFLQYKSGGSYSAISSGMMSAGDGNWRSWNKEMSAGSLDVRFLFSSGRWDNNGGNDYTILSNTAWIKEGQIYYSEPGGDEDTEAPEITITAPIHQASIAGDTTVSAIVTDNVSVATVSFAVDGNVIYTAGDSPYSTVWDTTTVADGNHTITMAAVDTAGNETQKQFAVLVKNEDQAPVVSSVSASGNSGQVSVSAEASDDGPLASVAFYLGGSSLGEDTSAPYSLTVDTTAYTNGTYTLKAVATDGAGQQGEKSISYTINNTVIQAKTVHYKTAWSAANIHYSNTSWTTSPGEPMSAEAEGWFVKTVDSADGALLTFVFNDGEGIWDNNSDANYSTTLSEVWVREQVVYPTNPEPEPVQPTNATPVTVHYASAWSAANMHYNNGVAWSEAPGEAMTEYRDGWYSLTVDRYGSSLEMVFNDGAGTWDNNSESNYVSSLENLWIQNGEILDSDPESTDDVPPSVSLTAPSAGSLLTGTASLQATASDNEAMGRVEFLVDGSPVGSDSTSPYSLSWDTASVNNGSRQIAARAFDAAGNQATTTAITVTVSNEESTNTTLQPHPGSYSGQLGANVYADGVEFSIWWRDEVVDSVSVAGSFNGFDSSASGAQMTRITSGNDEDIWWVFIPGAKTGDEYGLVGHKVGTPATNQTWVADPYSEYNRYSNGNSVVVDHASFQWTDQNWQRPGWAYYAIYELHIKDFTSAASDVSDPHKGKYLGVVEKLDYLQDLGVTAIELLPTSEFPDAGYSWGYNTSLYFAAESGYAVNPSQGQEGVDQLKTLVDEAHKRGIAVILDMVFNHTANNDNHLWTIDNEAYFEGATPWGNRLNTAHPIVKRLGVDAIDYYMQKIHIDGFRFDATGNGWVDYTFLHELKNHAASIDPNVFFVYENLPNNPDLRTWGAQWSDSYHDRGRELLMDQNGVTAASFSQMIYYTKSEGWAASPVESVNYLESHDEDTLAYIMSGMGTEGAKWRSRQASVLLATSLGIPMIWMGQEFLRPREGQDIDEMPLDWSLTDTYSDVLGYYSAVFKLRRDNPALRQGTEASFTWQYKPWEADSDVVAYSLETTNAGDNKYVVLLNFSDSTKTVGIGFPANGTWTKTITETGWNGTETIDVSSYGAQVSIMGNSGVIYEYVP